MFRVRYVWLSSVVNAALCAALIALALQVSLGLMVFVVGLSARPSDVTFLLRHPGLFVRSVIAMNVVMPLVALWFAVVFSLAPAVKLALIALAMSPMPAVLPGKTLKSGGDAAYTVGLLAAESALSIVVVPLSVLAFGALLATPFGISAGRIAAIVGPGIFAPLAAGVLVRWLVPELAGRAAKPLRIAGTILLVAAAIPLGVRAWPAMRPLLGNGTLIAVVAMAAIGVIVGHVLGVPVRDNRTVLALATASRHPAVAIAVGSAILPGNTSVSAAIMLASVVGALAIVPYTKRSRPAPGPPSWTPPWRCSTSAAWPM